MSVLVSNKGIATSDDSLPELENNKNVETVDIDVPDREECDQEVCQIPKGYLLNQWKEDCTKNWSEISSEDEELYIDFLGASPRLDFLQKLWAALAEESDRTGGLKPDCPGIGIYTFDTKFYFFVQLLKEHKQIYFRVRFVKRTT